MPIYEYQCEACHHHLEALQKISDEVLRKCPSCGRTRLKRLISPPVFRLKGSGWYETDFKSEKEGRRNLAVEKDDKPAAPAADTPSPPKTGESTTPEAKPAAPAAATAKATTTRKAAARPKPAAKHRSRPRPAAARKARR